MNQDYFNKLFEKIYYLFIINHYLRNHFYDFRYYFHKERIKNRYIVSREIEKNCKSNINEF